MKSFIIILLLYLNGYRIDSEHFIVESDDTLSKLSDSIRDTAELQYNAIQKIMPLNINDKIIVRIAGSLKEYESLQPEGYTAPTWSVGIAYPKKGLIILRGDATHGPDEILRTFRHELAHIFLHNYSDKKIPKWFSEGFSMYFEEREGLSRNFRLIKQAFANAYIDIDSLETDFPDNPIDVQNAYLTSSEFFSYLLSEIGEDGLFKVFEYVKNGYDFRYAIYRVSGKTISEIEKEFKKSARFKYAWLPVITSSTTLWLFLTFLFIYVFVIKKRRANRRLEIMRMQEEMVLLEKFSEREDEKDKNRLIN